MVSTLEAIEQILEREEYGSVLTFVDGPETGAKVVLTANPGCHLQLRTMLAGTDMKVQHIIEVVDQAYSASGAYRGIMSAE